MLCWNVYVSDFNRGKIDTFNIFNHHSFYDDCAKARRKFHGDKDGFAEEVRKSLMYYFWSKCEWEIILSHWPSGEYYGMRTKTTIGDLCDKLGCKKEYESAKDDTPVTIRVFPDYNKREERKIDVYDQVMANWAVFIDYLWENRRELKARK